MVKRTSQLITLIATAAISLGLLVGGVTLGLADTSDPNWAGTDPIQISIQSPPAAKQGDLTVDGNDQVVASWIEANNEGERYLYEARSQGGLSAPQVITDVTTYSEPDVMAYGDRSFVAWVASSHALRETEIGTDQIRTVNSADDIAPSVQPALVGAADKLHLFFAAEASYNIPDIYYSSRDLTGDWAEPRQIYTHTAPLGASWPAAAIEPDGSALHLVWEENDHHTTTWIRYMRGIVGADTVTWTDPITLSTGVNPLLPDLAIASDGTLHATWGERIGTAGDDTYYVRYARKPAGEDWSAPVRIDPRTVATNQNSPTYVDPRLALHEADGETTVCVAWHGFREGDERTEETLVNCSDDGGASWESATENLSRTDLRASIHPAPAFDSTGKLHVVWQERENAEAGYKIYYAHALSQIFLPLIMRSN